MSVEPRHIRNERETREHYNLSGSNQDLPGVCIAWCGDDATNTWFYTGADHALLDLKHNGGITPCHKCLQALRVIIDKELGRE